MNRFQLESMRTGIADQLKKDNEKLAQMYADTTSTQEHRTVQAKVVADLKERFEGIDAQIKAIDNEAEQRLAAQAKRADNDAANPKARMIKAKAEMIRATMQNRQMSNEAKAEFKAQLVDTPDSGGGKFLPKNVATEIVAEPTVSNPLRKVSTITNIPNLEVPKVAFSISGDDFILDGQTAKEIEISPDMVQFGRNKFKVFVDVSETILLGTDTNLVSVVDANLESGLQWKEQKVAFSDAPKPGEEHMSFYAKTGGSYDIKTVAKKDLYHAVKAAYADLGEFYRPNATVMMRYVDYIDMIEILANGNANLYTAQPEQILGIPAVFCDLAVIPVIGNFAYSHFNYDIQMLYERDKNVKTGMESFVLTAWFDHQIKLKSAFRLATVEGANP